MDLLNDTIEMNRRVIVLKKAYYDEMIEKLLDNVEILDDCTAKVRSEEDSNKVYQVNYIKKICQCPSFNFSEYAYCKHIAAARRKVKLRN